MFRMARALLPGMLERGVGSIINMPLAASSVIEAPNRRVYGAPKAAAIGCSTNARIHLDGTARHFEMADGEGLGLVQAVDRLRIDLNACTANMLVNEKEIATSRAALDEHSCTLESQPALRESFRARVRPFSDIMSFKGASAYKYICNKSLPRDSH